jgi:hypothetical protein
MPHTAALVSVKAMDGANAREFSFGASLQIVGRRKSLYVCNAPKTDAKLEPGSLSRRHMAVIAMSPQFGHYGLRRKMNWWDNFKKKPKQFYGLFTVPLPLYVSDIIDVCCSRRSARTRGGQGATAIAKGCRPRLKTTLSSLLPAPRRLSSPASENQSSCGWVRRARSTG